MTEESKPDLPMSAVDFLHYVNDRNPILEQISPSEIVRAVKDNYLRPDWPHWRNMAEVSLQQAVWLSLGIEPWKEMSDEEEAIEGICMRPAPVVRRRYEVQLKDSLRQDYQPRMTQCLAAIKAKTLPARWRDTNDPDLIHDLTVRWYVSLEHFRQWGESLRHPYPFPDEFPRPLVRAAWSQTAPADQQVTPPPPSETPAEPPTSPVLYAGGMTWVDAEYDERLKKEKSSPPDDDEPDTKKRGTYLRTIRALAVLAKLIDDNGEVATGAAGKVARRVQTLGFNNGPKERTIRDLLNEAASLKPGD